MTTSDHSWAPLASWLGTVLGRTAPAIVAVERLSGGAIQDNLLVRAAWDTETHSYVLRRDAAATIASSRSRADEFAILQLAWAAGVTVAEPIAFCAEPDVAGGPFALMAEAEGIAFGPRVVKDLTLGGDRERLVERLGAELAAIHAIPAATLTLLGPPPGDAAEAEIRALEAALDALAARRPALEWGLRWAGLNVPAPVSPVLTHRDFRTGNLMLDATGLTAILDWEFAGWGDPMADLGWFCAECWRFGRRDLEAGGLGSREALYRGYRAAGGQVDDDAVRYWEVVAHLRWAVIALQQGERHRSGREPSLEHALTGRIAAELDLAVLRATAPAAWGRHVA